MKVLIVKANPETNEVETTWLEGTNLLVRAENLLANLRREEKWKGWTLKYVAVPE
jgi:hypothetical protein